MRADLRQLSNSAKLALPFPGRYVSEPRRNYFKLGAPSTGPAIPTALFPTSKRPFARTPKTGRRSSPPAASTRNSAAIAKPSSTFDKVLQLRPDYAPALVNSGETYLKLDDRPAAQTASPRRPQSRPPNAPTPPTSSALLAAESNDLEAARQRFQQAIEAQRDHTGAINNLGVLYARMGQPQNSIAAFRFGLKADPDDDQLYLNLARIYVTMGERDQARAVLNQLMDRKPGNAIAAKALNQLAGR